MSEEEKVLVALNEEEQIMVKSICLDKDPEEAIYFVTKVLAPKIKKKAPCLGAEPMRSKRL